MNELRATVVIASYNRPERLARLLAGLARQDTDSFDIVVVDDGSEPPVSLPDGDARPDVQLIRQSNGGPAVARDAGIRACSSDVVILVDDDMVVPEGFVRAHLERHSRGADVVIGRFSLPTRSPLNELQLRGLARYFDACEADEANIVPFRLCTGNVSFRRALYERVGGFALDLRRSEDKELGIRFGLSGATFGFASGADTTHDDDVLTPRRSAQASFEHGRADVAIAQRHPAVDGADPWQMLEQLPKPAVWMLIALMYVPKLMPAANVALVGFGNLMLRLRIGVGVTAVFGLAHLTMYYAGVVDGHGGARLARDSLPCVAVATTPPHRRRSAMMGAP